MRHLALLAVVLPTVALAQNAPSAPAPSDDESKSDVPKSDKPKGRIIDPWARIPRPRDHMRLPDPRAAAEKATARGTVAPADREPTTPVEPPPEPQVTVEPAPAPAPTPAAAPMPPFPAPKTPFRTTTMSVVRPPVAPHEGLTLEAGTGIGWIHLADRYNSVTSPGGVAGVSIGIGGWLDENVALTARLAGSSVLSSQGLVVAAFLGPSFQIWFGERSWFGAGVGFATFGIDAERSENDVSLGGYAADLRVGHTFYANGKHTLNGSLEVTPGRVSEDRPYGMELSLNVTSIGILFGWQYL